MKTREALLKLDAKPMCVHSMRKIHALQKFDKTRGIWVYEAPEYSSAFGRDK